MGAGAISTSWHNPRSWRSVTGPAVADYRWLVSPDAAPWLAQAADSSMPLHVRAVALRRILSPEQTHLVLEQVELRRRGLQKFSQAAQLFFTRLGLEQATDELTARYKALRFPEGCVADLCCGVGGDLMALERRGPVIGIDRNEPIALLAAANAQIMANTEAGQGGASQIECNGQAEVRVQDVEDCLPALTQSVAWHLDPDRRPHGRRTTRVEFYEPGPEVIQRLLAANPQAAIKLAPAAEVPWEMAEAAELEWISRRRECRQLVAWFGDLARAPGKRAATVLAENGRARTILGSGDGSVALAPRIGRYVFEPDSAVLAAHLEGALAAEHGLGAITGGLAYLTGDQPVHDPAIAEFEVEEVLPFQPKRLKQLLRQRGIGRLEIKKRGLPHQPEELRKTLAVAGDGAATLLLLRHQGAVTAILAKRTSGETVA